MLRILNEISFRITKKKKLIIMINLIIFQLKFNYK